MGHKLFIPLAYNNLSPEKEFLRLLKEDHRQRRKILESDHCLIEASRLRVLQVAENFSHCFGMDCANRIVRRICQLPVEYPENGNSIESLVAGTSDPLTAFLALARSPSHADHLFGLNDFFLPQTKVGISFLEKIESPHRFYFVILISK